MEPHEVLDLELLRAHLWSDALWEVGILAQDRPQLLAAAAEELVQESAEVLGLPGERLQTWLNRDDRTLDLWLGPEAPGSEDADTLDVRQGAYEDRELPICTRSRLGEEPLRHLSLDRHVLAFARWEGCQHADEGACDAVGQVGDEGERTSAQGMLELSGEGPRVLQAIAPDQRDSFAQTLLEDPRQVPVQFARHDLAAALQQRFGQSARARAHLEYKLPCANSGGLQQPPKLVLVVKEVLPKGFLRPKAVLGQDRPDLTEGLHDYQV